LLFVLFSFPFVHISPFAQSHIPPTKNAIGPTAQPIRHL
jgi:hypothetical protein